MTSQPRRLITPKHDAKVHYGRMLWDEFAPGGMLARDDFTRNGLLFAYGIVRHVNGRTGVSKVGIAKLAQDLGFESGNHGFSKTLRILLTLGFLTRTGSAGRAATLALSMPEVLRDKLNKDGDPVYEDLMYSATGDIITVTDTSKTADTPTPSSAAPETPEDEPAATAEPEQWANDDQEPGGDDLPPPPVRRAYRRFGER